MALRDHVLLIDGPLEGRRFCVDSTPTIPLDFHAAIGLDGAVLAVEGEPAPVNVFFQPAEFRYVAVLAEDGHQSRGDDGCLRYRFGADVRADGARTDDEDAQ